jgi:hypothetical protein
MAKIVCVAEKRQSGSRIVPLAPGSTNMAWSARRTEPPGETMIRTESVMTKETGISVSPVPAHPAQA